MKKKEKLNLFVRKIRRYINYFFTFFYYFIFSSLISVMCKKLLFFVLCKNKYNKKICYDYIGI